jgi:uncharacterized protein YjbI with pentapeptide repeats
MGLQTAICGCTKSWKPCWIFRVGMIFVLCATTARADIYQWEWANPEHTIKQPSTTLCPGGAGGTAVPNADLSYRDLTRAYLTNTNLQNASFHFSTLANADLSGANLTGALFWQDFFFGSSTNLCGANLSGANLTRAQLVGCALADANFAGATVAEAKFEESGLTIAQLYSTASYLAKDLHEISLWDFDLSGANLAGQNLKGAGLGIANLTDTNLSGANLMWASLGQVTSTTNLRCADLRSANTGSLSSAITYNMILPNGSINGLSLAAGESLTIRNNYAPYTPVPIKVLTQMALDPTASLQFVFDGRPWGSTISFGSGISSVSLDGELHLMLAPGVQFSDLMGETFKLFDWTGVSRSGGFDIIGDPHWDTSHLYSSGEITFVPEPTALVLLGITAASVFAYAWRRRRQAA